MNQRSRRPLSLGNLRAFEAVARTLSFNAAANELHVHGAEQTLPLEAGVKGVLEFNLPADLAPGRYEVELHEGPILLFTLEVS